MRTQALIEVLSLKSTTPTIDPHLLRDFDKALVMARDGPVADKSMLWKNESTDTHNYKKEDHPELLAALDKLAPGTIPHSHVDWVRPYGNDKAEVSLSDALKAALTNLLAVDGKAKREYKYAKQLQDKGRFNRFNALPERMDRIQRLMVDHMKENDYIGQLKFALCRRHLKDLDIKMVQDIDKGTFMRSITRQVYSLLGRLIVQDSKFGVNMTPDSLEFFGETKKKWNPDTYTTMSDLYKNTVKGTIGVDDIRYVYLVRNEDLLIGSFAYSSSLLEQQL